MMHALPAPCKRRKVVAGIEDGFTIALPLYISIGLIPGPVDTAVSHAGSGHGPTTYNAQTSQIPVTSHLSNTYQIPCRDTVSDRQ
jgi:hypothetical protein